MPAAEIAGQTGSDTLGKLGTPHGLGAAGDVAFMPVAVQYPMGRPLASIYRPASARLVTSAARARLEVSVSEPCHLVNGERQSGGIATFSYRIRRSRWR